jgi:hypothetical protein
MRFSILSNCVMGISDLEVVWCFVQLCIFSIQQNVRLPGFCITSLLYDQNHLSLFGKQPYLAWVSPVPGTHTSTRRQEETEAELVTRLDCVGGLCYFIGPTCNCLFWNSNFKYETINIIHSYPMRLFNNYLQSEFWTPQVVALATTPWRFQSSSYFTSGTTNIVEHSSYK